MTVLDRVPLATLSLLDPEQSPRAASVDEEHAARLAALPSALPPILVHRPTMRVVDGAHRLRAAALRGDSTITVEYLDGDPVDVYLRAVEANAVDAKPADSGEPLVLPLTLGERKAAAERIITLRPQCSDRSIARVAGLSAKTVGELRRRSGVAELCTKSRLGLDGRLRPVNPDEGRRRVLQVMRERPDASLREIAQAAGVSLGTAHGVRARIGRGEAAVPARVPRPRRGGSKAAAQSQAQRPEQPQQAQQPTATHQPSTAHQPATVPPVMPTPVPRAVPTPRKAPESQTPTGATLTPAALAPATPTPIKPAPVRPAPVRAVPTPPAQEQPAQPPAAVHPFGAARRRPLGRRAGEAFADLGLLRRDPSLRMTDHGRALLMWLQRRLVPVSITERELQQIPAHLIPVVADLALECAAGWQQLGEQLQRRSRQIG
ncbi:ParB N-terminal domain-containing protein [Kitasatospora sp. GP30]|uniref:ParB N-terminal domain-containing protein n=1 Tax=Kitasatospora sp. GP30 TaxID=3035084 RepID=UPI000C70DF3B|nr:ParB N-terminal domain-containing protein [Kitasatospora sp. GP30]